MGGPEDRLLHLFMRLPEADRHGLLSYAEYLAARRRPEAEPLLDIALKPIPRPEVESVPQGLKRLRSTYPMLDAAALLASASDLLSQHLMLGRPASEVIDEMERLFLRHYQEYCRGGE